MTFYCYNSTISEALSALSLLRLNFKIFFLVFFCVMVRHSAYKLLSIVFRQSKPLTLSKCLFILCS